MPLQNWAAFLLLSSSTPFKLKMSSKTGTAKMPGKAQQAKREQQAARVTAESKKKSMQKRETDSKQQRAKKDNHGFVLILYINATLFRYIFPPTVLLGSCFVLSWLKCNARLYYPLVHRTPCPIVESTRLLPGNTCRE